MNIESNSIPKMELPSIKYVDFRDRTVVPTIFGFTVEDVPWMNIMLSGSLEYILNDKPILLTENHVAFFQVGDFVKRRQQHTAVRYISMRFSPGDNALFLPPLIPLLNEKQHTLVKMFKQYYQDFDLTEEKNRYASSLVLQLLLIELENNCIKNDTSRWLTEIRNYVMKNYMNGIRPADVAKAMALHPSYCNTLYRQHTGETISELICRIRLEHAVSKLVYSQLTIREIAQECGFRDVYYFSRWFHNHTNLSPSEYRQKLP